LYVQFHSPSSVGSLVGAVEIVFLNCTLDGVTFVPEMRKPFDVLAEGLLLKNSRGDKTAIELFVAGIADWDATTLAMLRKKTTR
jgi:hypothetical protein